MLPLRRAKVRHRGAKAQLELGAITPVFYAFRERETIQAVLEEASGGRMHYMFNRVGGLKEDIPAGWLDRILPNVDVEGAALERSHPVTPHVGEQQRHASTVG